MKIRKRLTHDEDDSGAPRLGTPHRAAGGPGGSGAGGAGVLRLRERRTRRAAGPDARPDRPKLADGLELIGEFEDSGFKEPRFIARRADGQVIQLTPLLYLVAANADGEREPGEIGDRVSEAFGRGVSADNVGFLIDQRLRPLGVLAARDGSSPEIEKADPLLALKFRAALVPEGVVRAITTLFRPLFWPPVIVAVLLALGALDAWLFLSHGVAQPARDLTYNPVVLLMVFGLVAVSAAFHECGHATACRYGGATPGAMGAGIYVVWPAFYTDVTDAYRLNKAGRLRTDLGGVYFNVIFSLVTAGLYFLTSFEPLLVVIVLQHLQVVYQFMPFLRLDGYYIISDLTGVPDMFARIKPVLRSLIPRREPDPRVDELKPWVRAATTVYVLALIPALVLVFGMMAISAPRVFATAWDSFFARLDQVSDELGDGDMLAGLGSCIQMAALVLPAVGMTLTASRVGRRAGAFAWTRSAGRPALRGAYGVLALAGASLLAFIWWPNGEYRPIQPDERGTIGGGVRSFGEIPSGRPGLSEARAAELGGAPGRSRRFGPPRADGAEQRGTVRREAPGQRSQGNTPATGGRVEEDTTTTPKQESLQEQAPQETVPAQQPQPPTTTETPAPAEEQEPPPTTAPQAPATTPQEQPAPQQPTTTTTP
jgi:putative peptide zinc metalloprotease protein